MRYSYFATCITSPACVTSQCHDRLVCLSSGLRGSGERRIDESERGSGNAGLPRCGGTTEEEKKEEDADDWLAF